MLQNLVASGTHEVLIKYKGEGITHGSFCLPSSPLTHVSHSLVEFFLKQ